MTSISRERAWTRVGLGRQASAGEDVLGGRATIEQRPECVDERVDVVDLLVSYANRRWQVMGYEQAAILGKPLEALVAALQHGSFSRRILVGAFWWSGG